MLIRYHLRVPAISLLYIETDAPDLKTAWEQVISDLESKRSGIRYRDPMCWEYRTDGGEWQFVPLEIEND